MRALIIAFAALGFAAAVAAVFAYAGYYDVAADVPHWGITAAYLESARERSIGREARAVGTPPALDDPAQLAMGAEHYDEMCVSCHLAPGKNDSEIRAGLYPKPPKLAEPDPDRSPAQEFWTIKHGVKMTAMPAWGTTHDDRTIWAMVAFLQKLPGLSHEAYEALVAQGSAAEGHSHDDHEGEEGHSHEAEEGHTHDESEHHHHDGG